MAIARSFRDLNVYKLARETSGAIFALTLKFPKSEQYSLTDQIRRSSRAVNAMVAEAWARRRYRGAFINKIDEALSEAMETQAWLDRALDCSYINAAEFQPLDEQIQHIGATLSRMIERADDFCKILPSSSRRSQ